MHVDDYPLAGQRNSGACCGVAATTNKWTLASEHHHTLVTKFVQSRNLNDNNSNYCTWYSQSWEWFVPECKEIKRPLSDWWNRSRDTRVWNGTVNLPRNGGRFWCLVPSRHGAHDMFFPASEDPCPGPKSSLNAEQTGEFVKHYVRCLEVPATPEQCRHQKMWNV